jgi:Rgg/GadR/MutR family transcriptional activator
MTKEIHYGRVFQHIRKRRKVSLRDLEDIVPRRTLSRYESGETDFPLAKLENLLERLNLNLIDFYHVLYQDKIYARYGKVFKKLRKQSGFTDKDFTHLSISKAQMELFESGKIMFEFDKLYAILMEMNVSLEDYCFILNKGSEDSTESFLRRVDLAYFRGDNATLKDLGEMAKADKRYFYLTIKVILGEITEEEIKDLEGYFMSVDLWTRHELFMFQYVSPVLNSSNLKMICTDILCLKVLFEDEFIYQRRLVLAGLEISLSRINKSMKVAAKFFLDFAGEFLQDSDELTGGAYRFVENIYLYTVTGEVQYQRRAKKMCDTALLYDGMMKGWYSKNYKNFITK